MREMNHIELNDEMKYLSDQLQQYTLLKGGITIPYPRDFQTENNRIKASEQCMDKPSSFVPYINKNSITMISHKRRSRFYLHAEFTDSSKSYRSLLPLYRKLPQNDIVPLLPDKNCFFNEYLIEDAMPAILFIDDVQFANRFDLSWHIDQLQFPVVSYWALNDDPQDLDWKLFKGKRIYYFLIEHSGRNRSETWHHALKILNFMKPKENTNGDPEVIFITLEGNHYVPMFSSEEQFRKACELESEVSRPLEPCVLWSEVPHPVSRTTILPPFVLNQTATLFHSGESSTQTKLLLSMAVAASQGHRWLNETVEPTAPVKVAFIHEARPHDDTFFRELQEHFQRLYPDVDLPLPVLGQTPQSVEEANYLLLQKQFIPYPELNDSSRQGFNQNNFQYFVYSSPQQHHLLLWKLIYNLKKHNPDVKVVFIDTFTLFPLLNHPDIVASLTNMLFQWRSELTIIFSTPVLGEQVYSHVYNFPFDTIIQVQKQKTECLEDQKVLLVFERYDNSNQSCIRKRMYLKHSQGSKYWTQQKRSVSSKQEMLSFLKRYKQYTESQLAMKLGISISYVKKLKREAGLVHPRPERAPKCPKRIQEPGSATDQSPSLS